MATVPASEVETRLERLRALLRRRRIGAAYLVGTASVRYFSGFTGDESALLVTASTCALITDSRFAEEAEASAPLAEVVQRTDGLATTAGERLRSLGVKAVGVEEDLLTLGAERALRRAASGIRRKGLDVDLRTLRQVKSDWEVRAIRRALRVAEGAFRDTLPFVVPGVREREVAAELEHRMRRRGASGAAFPTIVAARANASRPHAHPEGRRLRDNTMVLIDWGATVDGYHSDLTRTLFPGTVSPSWRARYEAVLCAQEAAIERIHAGMTGAEADAAARSVLEEAGLARRFGHGLGHGVGLEVHEGPTLSKRNDHPLPAGAVVTVEPGVYIPGSGGIRIEEMIRIGDDGAEVLSRLPKTLERVTGQGGGGA